MEDKTWGTLPTPKIYIELQGEFIDFNKEEEYLVCKFPVQSKYFNPMDTTLGGIIDSYMDVTMGPLSWLLGERVVTKSFSAKYIRPVTADDIKPGAVLPDRRTPKGLLEDDSIATDTILSS